MIVKNNFLYRICGILCMLLVGLLLCGCVHVTYQNITITDPSDTQTNYLQDAPVELSVFDGELLVFPRDGLFMMQKTLYRLDRGSLKEVKKPSAQHPESPLAVKDGYFYYSRFDTEEEEHYIYAYSIEDETEHRLIQRRSNTLVQSDSGTVYIQHREPNDSSRWVYYPVVGCHVGAPVSSIEEEYTLNDCTYTVTDGRVVCFDSDGAERDLGFALERYDVVPLEHGLLLASFNRGHLILIREGNTKPIELLNKPVYTEGALAVSGTDIYVSFSRPLANDADFWFFGTWHIDLTNFSVTKISDENYSGLFIFDDTGIFACDGNGNVHKLDWSGKRTQTVLKWIYPWEILAVLLLFVILVLIIIAGIRAKKNGCKRNH